MMLWNLPGTAGISAQPLHCRQQGEWMLGVQIVARFQLMSVARSFFIFVGRGSVDIYLSNDQTNGFKPVTQV
jgi:hypothetical protein